MNGNQNHLSKVDVPALGKSLSLFLVITYVLCVLFDFLLPEFAMHQAWQVFLPGFEWLTFESFLLGLAEVYAYGWYFALLWGGLFNYHARIKNV